MFNDMKKYFIIIIIIGLAGTIRFQLISNSPSYKAKQELSSFVADDLNEMNATLDLVNKADFSIVNQEKEYSKVQTTIKLGSKYNKRYEIYIVYRDLNHEHENEVKLEKIDEFNYKGILKLSKSLDYEYKIEVRGPNFFYSKRDPIEL